MHSRTIIKLGILRQYYATFIANLGVFGLGTVMSWTSAGLSSLEKSFPLTVSEKSWISSIINVGGLIGCLSAGPVMDKFGRKKSSMTFSALFLAGWILLVTSTNFTSLLIARFVLGYAASYYGVVGPVFVGEIASPNIRGILSNMYEVFLTLGILFSYIAGAYLDWKWLSIVCSFVPLLIPFSLLTIEESPRYYFFIGEEQKGIKSLKWYCGTTDDADVEEELALFQLTPGSHGLEDTELLRGRENRSTIRLLSKGENFRPLFLCVVLILVEQMSGFAAVTSFAGEIFYIAGFKASANEMAIIFGTFQFLATCLSCLFIENVGRKPLLLVGQIFMILSLGCLGLYFYNWEYHKVVTVSSWLPAVCMVTYIVALSVGIGPISTTIMGEILPQSVRGIGSAIFTAALRMSAFTTSFLFEEFKDAGGVCWLFWSFTVVCIIGLLVIVIWVPETKGKTFEDIARFFKPKRSDSVLPLIPK